MGTAHKFSKGHKTTTIIGTPHYMVKKININLKNKSFIIYKLV
jgi:hypothetical protein